MHVITRKRLNEFAEKHPDSLSGLAHWYRLMKRGRFRTFTHLRETFERRSRGKAHRLQYWRQQSAPHRRPSL
jgi:mRNA-degrading endonuclease HigB of HigAB toxin-antitoxin module